MLSIFIGLILFLAPTASQAANDITVPYNTIGVNEATFAEIEAASCSYDSGCDEIIESLKEYILLRVEKNGELYWLNTADGFPKINRYLPNGFYTAGKKHFYVFDGFRMRLKRGESYKKILKAVKGGAFTPISEQDYQDMIQICEGNNAECVASYNRGQELYGQLRGSMVMRVEDQGQLHYVRTGNDDGPTALPSLGKKVDGMSLFSFAKQEATTVRWSVIKQLIKGMHKYF